MITAFYREGDRIVQAFVRPNTPLADNPLCLDLNNPSFDEEKRIKQALNIAIPNREEIWRNHIAFQLDASLGMITVEQNLIAKKFAIVAVFFLPPILISSIYGMTFVHMPELNWPWGYPLAIGLMIAAAGATFFYFRRKGWL